MWRWWSADSGSGFRLAGKAKDDCAQVLQIDPDYVDAKLVVGVYELRGGRIAVAVQISDWLRGDHGIEVAKAWNCCGTMRIADRRPTSRRAP